MTRPSPDNADDTPAAPAGEDAPHILVVDDDRRLRELLSRYLGAQGFRVTTAEDAGTARASLQGFDFDLLVMDVMMPGETGLELTEWLRRDSAVPILMLTAMGEAEDRIAGLELGADDYLAKPFEPRELVLRIRRILARAEAPRVVESTVTFGDCAFDLARHTLTRRGRRVHLTTTEASLLAALAQRAGEVMSREALTQASGEPGTDRAIDVQVTRLRRKLEDDPRLPRYLCTVRGQGYVLRPD